MSVRLIDSLATKEPLAELFSDRSVLRAMLEFEVALARAQAGLGMVPPSAAEAIAAAARVEDFDIASLSEQAMRAGALAIPLVQMLRERVRQESPVAADFVHCGATSQDVADTALILLLRRSQPILQGDLKRLEEALFRLSEEHSQTVMLGRTLLVAAPPVTFGLKAAGWLAAVRRNRRRLASSFPEALIVQFGGASGTLAALGDQGLAVAKALAGELKLTLPEAPWHSQRDRLAALVSACAILTGSLGKMARDVALLMQTEVAEVAEPGGEGRGGSSTMPHKHNPVGCVVTLAAAHRMPGLVASFLSGMVQEHERAAGGWQAEWPTVAGVVEGTGVATASMAEVAEGLTVDASRMRFNIEATHGVVFAEKAMMLLSQKLGRNPAQKILDQAIRQSRFERRNLSDVLAEIPEVTRHLDGEALRNLDSPEDYLGATQSLIRRLLREERAGKKEG
ncbi:MAG TPA: 3-carboxy-cis,cis-muconate cycloisomerase [Terriglobales bacterium]|nr:3-carboxy-cis,cis-muconate cycloisomerase [Terriglobales bacterium]